MNEDKQPPWETSLNKQFFGGVPMEDMGSNHVRENELQGFIRSLIATERVQWIEQARQIIKVRRVAQNNYWEKIKNHDTKYMYMAAAKVDAYDELLQTTFFKPLPSHPDQTKET